VHGWQLDALEAPTGIDPVYKAVQAAAAAAARTILPVPLPMHARVVREVAERAGIGLEGIEVQLEDGPDWAHSPFYGCCDAYGEVIILFPRAFKSEEQLVRTLGHERTHAYQGQFLGPARDNVDMAVREVAAIASEETWWEFYRDRR
jgi:hypothetical protein